MFSAKNGQNKSLFADGCDSKAGHYFSIISFPGCFRDHFNNKFINKTFLVERGTSQILN